MTINTTTLEANLTTKINATSGSTDGKEFLLLGKAVEAVNTAISNNSLTSTNNLSDLPNAATARTNLGVVASTGGTFTGDVDFGANKITYANVYSQLADLPSASTYHGMFAHVHATGKGYYAHGGNWIPLVNEDTSGNVTIGGNLTVSGTTTTVNSTTLDVADLNITVAKGAADAAAADGAGLTVDGASATFNYASSGDKWTTNKPLDVTGAVTATGATVNGKLDIEEVFEKVQVSTTTSGTITFPVDEYGVRLQSVNQTANRTINFSNVNANLGIGQSVTCAIAMAQGSTAYYLNAYQIDGSAVTPKWQGGSAPTSGNASGIDVYNFTIIKTASATFTVLASVSQFA
jgi:hypothetical protein